MSSSYAWLCKVVRACVSYLTDVHIFPEDLRREVVDPSLVTSARGRVPSVDEVELGADLVADSSRCAL